MTTGRNAPCPCGSGKKYKRCCGAGTVPTQKKASTDDVLAIAYQRFNAGDLPGAEVLCRQALAVTPRNGSAVQLEALIAQRKGDLPTAIRHMRKALELDPRSPAFAGNLGTFLCQMGETDEGEQYFKQALALDPSDVRALNNLGNLEKDRGNLDAARRHYEQALAIKPDYLGALISLANIYRDTGQFAKAGACYQRALSLVPGDPDIRFNAALMDLMRGDLVAGWTGFEARFNMQTCAISRRPFAHPNFQGPENVALAGRTLLVWGEQGVGDEILFASQIDAARQAGARVVLECEPRLKSLFARSFPGVEVIARTDPPSGRLLQGDIDCQAPAGSLARWFRSTLDSFPRQRAYLEPDPQRIDHWRAWLAALGATESLKVGISWRSGLRLGARNWYYTDLNQWGEILRTPGVVFVNLQYGECREELEEARRLFGVEIHQASGLNLKDELDDAAALTRALDLVIAPNTSVFAMAGAVGTPTWMLNLESDWTMLGTERMPWFPGVTVYLRRWGEPWEGVLSRMALALAEEAREGNP